MRRSRNSRSHRIRTHGAAFFPFATARIHFSYTFLVLKATSQMGGIGNNGRGQPEQWIRNGLFRLRFADVIITFKIQTFATVSPRFGAFVIFAYASPSDSLWAVPVFAQEHVPDCDVRHHSMVFHSNGRALFSIFHFCCRSPTPIHFVFPSFVKRVRVIFHFSIINTISISQK